MDKAVKEYRKRRQERLDARKPIRMDAVDRYKKRRYKRMQKRFDRGMGWVYHALKEKGVDPSGWDLGKALDEWNKINGEKGGQGKEEQPEKTKKSPDSWAPTKKSPGAIKAEQKNAKNRKSEPNNNRLDKECDGTKYSGDPGNVKTGKNGNLSPKSDGAKKIDTADAIGETELYKKTGGEKGIAKNSLSDHVDANGNLSPERQKVHDEIVQRVFATKVPYDGKATMIMSGGGPASGKSFVSENAQKEFGEDTVVVIDPDEVKKMLPGFGDMAVEGTQAAGFYHEESSALAKRIYQYAVENGINCVYDGTGDGSVGSVMKKLKTAQDAGYNIRGEYVTVNVEGENGALTRNLGRYEHSKADWDAGKKVDPPRLVKDEHVKDIHAKVSDIAPNVANLFDEWVLTDNNVARGAERPVIATCKKGGEIEVVPGMEQKVQDWLDKGTRGGKVANGRIVFPDEEK